MFPSDSPNCDSESVLGLMREKRARPAGIIANPGLVGFVVVHQLRKKAALATLVGLLLALSSQVEAGSETAPAANPEPSSIDAWLAPGLCAKEYCDACPIIAFAACAAVGSSLHDYDCVPTTDGDAMCACI